MELYFIALVPDKKLKKELKLIKEDFADKFHTRHALKLPPHITLIPPFKIPLEKEEYLITKLKEVSIHEKPFSIKLSGYGSFKARVIFIDIKNKKPLAKLFGRIKETLNDLSVEILAEKEDIIPHITIATRDLSREVYKRAWPQYSNRAFKGKFEVKDLVLFRHNGKHWEKVQGSFTFNYKDSED